jgi:transposase InsO family protein
MCKVLEVSASAYYDWRERPPSKHNVEDKLLIKKIEGIHEQHKGNYGARRIRNDLLDDSDVSCVSRQRVARLMREEGLECKRKKKFKTTTNSDHDKVVAPDLLKRDFSPAKPDKSYVSDITYIWTSEGWLYLAVVIDLFSRIVVGWSLSSRMTTAIVTDALEMAIANRRPAAGLIHHSDRGVQYASGAFRQLLELHDYQCSMSRKGNCWDNAVAESFFRTLKSELIYQHRYDSREQAKAAIFEYIEVYYNRQRKHSSNDYMSPYNYEQKWLEAA